MQNINDKVTALATLARSAIYTGDDTAAWKIGKKIGTLIKADGWTLGEAFDIVDMGTHYEGATWHGIVDGFYAE